MPLDDQNELFYWVDENDEVLGTITRKEAHDGSKKIHRSIHIFVFHPDGRILLQKRSMKKDTDPGKWALSVGGHVKYGQTYEEAAIRELKEELGIKTTLDFVSKDIYGGKIEREISSGFRATINFLPEKFDKDEIDEVVWFSKPEVSEFYIQDKIADSTVVALKAINYI